ncbi:MAG: histidine kinase [Pseudomonadales bacterium]|nr:histidine kinase [Pseudomonadales bacterium]
MNQLLAAQAEARRSLAREVHDGLGQELAVIRLLLGQLQGGGAGGAEGLDDVLGILDAAIGRVRRLEQALYPPMLDDLGLGAALRWRAGPEQAREGAQGAAIELDLGALDDALPLPCVRAFFGVLDGALDAAQGAGLAGLRLRVRQRGPALGATLRASGLAAACGARDPDWALARCRLLPWSGRVHPLGADAARFLIVCT